MSDEAEAEAAVELEPAEEDTAADEEAAAGEEEPPESDLPEACLSGTLPDQPITRLCVLRLLRRTCGHEAGASNTLQGSSRAIVKW